MGMILQWAASLVYLICWIIVTVKLFQAKQTIHGILSILTCSLWGFIWGWVKSKELALQKIMLVWTAAWVLAFVSNFLPGGGASKIKQAIQDAQSGQMAPSTP